MGKIVIETKKLTKFYGKNRGIENLDLSVKEGEIFGFLGPNGAGKSTTIKLLLNFINPTSGEMEVFGLNPKKQITAIVKKVGYLPGEIHMYEQLSGKDHLAFQAKLQNQVDSAYINNLAERLDASLNKPVKSLSHGNKQKIALIAALMSKPNLLILDEPTTGLDPLIQQQFYQIISEIKNQGTTVFVCSHILPEIERICDRVAIIRDGKLVVIEEIANLKKTAKRRVEVFFKNKPDLKDFKAIKNLSNLVFEKDQLSCTVEGSFDIFLKTVAKYEVLNLITQEPNLEEIFLKYYKGGG